MQASRKKANRRKKTRKQAVRRKAARGKPPKKTGKKKATKRERKARAEESSLEPLRVEDPLIGELIVSGILNRAAFGWALEHSAESEVPLDTALLELDLVDEEDLLGGLESAYRLTAARPGDLVGASPRTGKLLPEGFGRSFDLCPVRLSGNQLVALVGSPLPPEAVEELGDLFRLETRQLVAPSHYLALARAKVYEVPVDPRTRELEARLARRRGASEVKYHLASVSSAATLTSAIADILDFAACLLEHSCFVEGRGSELRAVTVRDSRLSYGEPIAVPEMDCLLGTALRYGGYFVGPVAGAPADRSFYRAMGFPLPRWAMAVPVPVAGDRRLVLYADNGPRGIATSWVAKLTLLTSRLGHRGSERSDSRTGGSSTSFEEAFEKLVDSSAEPDKKQPAPDPWTPGERAAMVRLRRAAAGAGLTVDALVDELMRERGIRPPPEDTTALVGEIKALFEKLASDIPAQLARGMETAFCKMAPRLAADPPAACGAAKAAGVGLVRKEAADREVPSYRSRRRKQKLVKL